jgi:excisionase family DNA binding protein
MKRRPGQERLTYSITEVAEMLGISPSMAYESVHRGEIPAVRIGRRVLVPKDRLADLLELDADHGVELP